jgi:hypothetical protein
MIVWSRDNGGVDDTGGVYDRVGDSWTATPTGGEAPSARTECCVVWTGKSMIVWGGQTALSPSVSFTDTGSMYFPPQTHGTWRAAAVNGAPEARVAPWMSAAGKWTGQEFLVWGGQGSPTKLDSGALYSTLTQSWRGLPSDTWTSSVGRDNFASAWTGTEYIVWGGTEGGIPFASNGARYNPITRSWAAMASGGAPTGRINAAHVWTGTHFIVWGGQTGAGAYAPDGARYDPALNSWTPVSFSGLTARARVACVWTGREMLIWGGETSTGRVADGAAYNPITDTWRAISATGAPEARQDARAIWTGTTMVVWGGSGVSGDLNTGGMYDPFTDTWTATATTGAVPSARRTHVMVWTGQRMLVNSGTGSEKSSAIFNPRTNAWSAMASSTVSHSEGQFAWTGTSLIVFGGADSGLHNATAIFVP